ncbi:hypothetical protein HBI56_221650 [Parastagonospora nodorum]|nr:hypothetical protein HBI09_215430 [Parastagonospora nodorum]KAH4216951.1 hypothetical protein HBI06_222580 [Parastagonospora nodorum]KAH4226170.1 hypothetical protein HBI05_224250 [Parastagonospora nodorum]KAH4335505.1 hypothetical protein HBH98_234600 [Parastagonospora nodorum]KAH4358209.1 hypothetical protein HBH97_219210 [Parastagonospora nodorum]
MKSRTLMEKSYQAIEEAALTCPRVGIAYLCWSASFENAQPRVADFRWRLTSEASVGFAFVRRHPIKNERSCSQCCSWMLGREDSAPSRERRLQYGITPHRFSAFTVLHDMVSKHKIRLSHAIHLLDRGTAIAGKLYQWRR